MNVCHKCKYWSKCLFNRYNGVVPKKVTKYEVESLIDGHSVVYVHECEGFVKYKPFTGSIK